MRTEPIPRHRIQAMAAEFRALTGFDPQVKFSLLDKVQSYRQVLVHFLEDLSLARVQAWLDRQGLPFSPQKYKLASKHGYLEVNQGAGLIFLDANDPQEELNFTLAHELAHYLIEHVEPDQQIRKTLQGGGFPASENLHDLSIASHLKVMLAGIELAPFRNLLDEPERGLSMEDRYIVARAEQNADRLAYELLAPFQYLHRTVNQSSYAQTECKASSHLERAYGFPVKPARRYAKLLAARLHPEPVLPDWLNPENFRD